MKKINTGKSDGTAHHGRECTFKEVARELGVSRQWAMKLEQSALKKVRRAFLKEFDEMEIRQFLAR